MPENDSNTKACKYCVALGVSSSIAAYKAVDLTSRFVKAGIDVHVLMTENATRLIGQRTFLTLSQNPVTTSLWDVPEWRPEHIALSEQVQLLVVAPATANVLAKLAHGIADDALSTFALAHEGPLLIAPAMNPKMWRHPAVQENCRILKARGAVFIDPEPGPVACGADEAPGRMADPARICRAVSAHLAIQDLPTNAGAGRKLVVTAGPTREPLDPIRFLTNRSSGKMGYAVAEAASALGFETVLVSGPTCLPPPSNCRIVDVVSAEEMNAAVLEEFKDATGLVMCAAVADFRPAETAGAKIKKGNMTTLELPLARTPDILANVAEIKKSDQRTIGFAAESGDPVGEGRRKLADKKLDWIVANDVSRDDTGFASDQNQAVLISTGSEEPLPKMPKIELAAKILQKLL